MLVVNEQDTNKQTKQTAIHTKKKCVKCTRAWFYFPHVADCITSSLCDEFVDSIYPKLDHGWIGEGNRFRGASVFLPPVGSFPYLCFVPEYDCVFEAQSE